MLDLYSTFQKPKILIFDNMEHREGKIHTETDSCSQQTVISNTVTWKTRESRMEGTGKLLKPRWFEDEIWSLGERQSCRYQRQGNSRDEEAPWRSCGVEKEEQ